jgi:putative acyl-CoA dehydrogenase
VWWHTEVGHACPMVMTYAVVPTLRRQPELAARHEPLLASRVYDPGLRAPATKRGQLAGMAMTEKQGGSDVAANTTTATPTAETGLYTLRGHKWFTSAPMCDLFLVLAQAPDGLSCFLVPRVLPDGTFWSGTRPPPSRTRSARPGSPATGDTRTAPCPARRTWPGS